MRREAPFASDLAGSLLAAYVSPKKAPALQNKAGSSASRSAKAANSKESPGKRVEQVKDPSPEPEAKEKGSGKGKAARIPTDVEGWLGHEGFNGHKTTYDGLMDKFLEYPFDSTAIYDVDTAKALEEGRAKLAKSFEKLMTELQKIETRMERRSWTPSDAIHRVKECRLNCKAAQGALTEVGKAEFDVTKVMPFLDRLHANDLSVGNYGEAKVFSQRCKDFIRFCKWAELDLLLKSDKNFEVDEPEALARLLEGVGEMELQKMLQKMVANPKSDQATNMMKKINVLGVTLRPWVQAAAQRDLEDVGLHAKRLPLHFCGLWPRTSSPQGTP